MNSFWELAPWLIAMVILICFSAFFSASEAALFYLRAPERRRLKDGSPTEQIAAALLSEPDRLLTAVLFWNLVINVAYFAISSIARTVSKKDAPPPPYFRGMVIPIRPAWVMSWMFSQQ